MEIQNFIKFEDINPDELAGIMKQYYTYKSEYKDFIILFREGKFFETYFQDAVEMSNLTGITLTKKKLKTGNILMAGIPFERLDVYVEKLVSGGQKVVVVNTTGEIDENGKIKRGIEKIYTKGTLLELEFLNPKENNFLASIYAKDNKLEFAYSDVSTGSIYYSTGSFEQILSEIAGICPKELLIPDDFSNDNDFLFAYTTVRLKKDFYSENFCDNAACTALINYAKYILKEYTPQFEKAKFYSTDENLLMDFITRKNLELTQNAYNGEKYGSLLWAIDNCKTPMGARLLSSYVSSPVKNLEEIKKRQGTISQYLKNEKTAQELSYVLENTGDLLRLSSRLSNETATPLEFLTIKEGLKIINEIENIIKKLNLPVLSNNFEDKNLLTDFFNILNRTISDDIDLIKKGDFIKRGANAELDILYAKLNEEKEKIKAYEFELQTVTKIRKLEIIKKKGRYLVEVPAASSFSFSSEFLPIQKTKDKIRYTTKTLSEIEEKIYSNEGKINEVKHEIFKNLKKYSKELSLKIRDYSKTLALLDAFYSLYICAKENNFVCPVFNDSNELEFKQGRHFTAQKILKGFEPLDLDFKNSNISMLTGANGIGKSTLLKQTAILIIMAQAGFFVPCLSARLPLTDKLFSVLNVSDEILNKKSTHQKQMKELSKILNSMTDKSVILFDEIGKNTSYQDGISILYGLIKYLSKKTDAKILFATHFYALKPLLESSDINVNYLEILNKNNKRTVVKGVASDSSGIEIAKNEGLPEEIINFAKETLNNL